MSVFLFSPASGVAALTDEPSEVRGTFLEVSSEDLEELVKKARPKSVIAKDAKERVKEILSKHSSMN